MWGVLSCAIFCFQYFDSTLDAPSRDYFTDLVSFLPSKSTAKVEFLNDTKHHYLQFNNATIRIPTKMYNDAMTIAHSDPNIKNFSRFCEMLIWERLGRSKEYLKSPNQESLALASGIPEEDGD